WLTAAQHHLMSLRYKHAPGFGVAGGADGATGGIWIWDAGERPAALSDAGPGSYRDATPIAGVLDPDTNAPARDGVYHYPYRRPYWETGPGAVLRYVNCAGGGWGDPLERDPQLVRRDVRDGYVTIAGAARTYGVVIEGDPEYDPEGLTIDVRATERLRASLS
ncbi:MAG: hydantoinase B/oxoprolinase family protein, partial [Solirubrobacteraceae bacterium]